MSLGGGGGGGGTTLTIGTIDSVSPSADGAVISGTQLIMQSASGAVPGLVNLTAQTFLGQKTFTTGLTGTLTGHASLDVATSSLGNLTDAGTDGIVVTGGTGATVGNVSLAQHVADTTHNGYLSSTDWNTFNSKQAAGNYITALTGDGTASGPGSVALTLATVNSNVGSFSPAAITVNGKGLITAASNVVIGNLTDAGTDGIVVTGGTGAVLGSGTSLAQHVADTTHNGYLSSTDWNTFNGKQASGNYITALTGDVTASGPGSVAATIAAQAVTNAKLANVSTATFKGRTTAGTGSPEDLTATQATALINAMVGDSGSGGTKGLVPAPASGDAAALKFLKADGTWAVPAGTGMTNPMTTTGDLIYASNTATPATPARLAIGTANQILGPLGSNTTPSYRSINEAAAGPNYIRANPNAEVDTTGWATFADAASNIPVDGTGGSATGLTFSRSTSSPLSGTGQFSMVQANSTSLQGKGVSYDFTIDAADKAQNLGITFRYNASSTFIGGNGITAPLMDNTVTTNAGNSDIEIFIYDVTNAVLISVVNPVITGNGSNNFVYQGSFQTASNSTSYRLIFYVATASANATGWTFLFDNVYVGPQLNVQGMAGTDWATDKTFTINGLGTVTSQSSFYRRVGDTMFVRIYGVSGTAAATTFSVTLPNAIDNTKLSSGTGGQVLGSGSTTGNGAATAIYAVPSFAFIPFYDGSDTAKIYIAVKTSSAILVKCIGTDVSFNTEPFSMEFQYPVAGWSSNVNMSSTTLAAPTVQKFTSSTGTYTTPAGVKYIKVKMVGGGGGGGGGGSGAGAGGNGGSTTFGTSFLTAPGGSGGSNTGPGGVGGTAGTINSPALQVASIPGGDGGACDANVANSTGGNGGSSAFGGAGIGGVNTIQTPTSAKTNSGSGGGGGYTSAASGSGGGGAGTYIEVIIANPAASYATSIGAGGTAGAGSVTPGTGGAGYIVVEEYYASQGSIAQDASVNCKYQNTAGTSITSSSATVPFATKIYDTHNAFNNATANTFVAPMPGKYEITAQLITATVSNSTSQIIELYCLVTSTPEGLSAAKQTMDFRWGEGVSHPRIVTSTRSYQLNAGDLLAIQADNSNTITLDTTAGNNFVTIKRIGN